MTNEDHIKSMTTDELAKFLQSSYCDICVSREHNFRSGMIIIDKNEFCKNCDCLQQITDWLKSESRG